MEWTQYTGHVNGMCEIGVNNQQWRPGTKYVRIVLVINCQQEEEFELLVDDIFMTSSD
ncbi:hypothetical protein ACFLQR_01185 [Verrucomicrobiota bacterium]